MPRLIVVDLFTACRTHEEHAKVNFLNRIADYYSNFEFTYVRGVRHSVKRLYSVMVEFCVRSLSQFNL